MFQMLSIVHIVLAVILITLVLVQRANTDASGAFSTDGGTAVALKKRGGEKVLHQVTIIVVTLFALSLLLPVFFH